MDLFSQRETALADARQEIREAVRQAKALVSENEALQRRQSELAAALAVAEKNSVT
jgi:regulator of replication initiation timing